MKNKNISRACLAAALVMAGTVSAHASALRSSAPETEAAVMIMDNTRMARPKAKIVKEYAPTNRPAESERLFRSEAVEAEIARIKGVLSNAKLAWMFENCFPNTLDTTVRYRKDDNGRDDTVVYTGDIHAMWLRDSGAQVWPYLQLANKDEHLRSMLAGVIRRQFKCIELDPYANAFLDPYDPNPDHQWMSDQTQMRPELHERKWEIDSLCYPLRLAYANPESAAEIRRLAENLDLFDFVPNVHTPGEYGRYMIQDSGHFDYDSNLDAFYDYEKYGQQRIQQEQGIFTERGYIAYQGTLSLDELMRKEPAEQYQRERDESMEMGGLS